MKKIVETHSREETLSLAEELSKTLKGGEVLLAEGELGSGKTCFAKGLAKGLGVQDLVNSPTFNLVKVYRGRDKSFYHVDCYRLEGVEEDRKDLDFADFLGEEDVITYVEWPQDGPKFLQDLKGVLRLSFEFVDENSRRITIDDTRK